VIERRLLPDQSGNQHGIQAAALRFALNRIAIRHGIGNAPSLHRHLIEAPRFQLRHQLPHGHDANPVLAGIYAALMSKVHRARGAANADMLRWQESHTEHEEIIAALREPGRPRLADVLRRHSENTAKEVLRVVEQTLAEPAALTGADRR